MKARTSYFQLSTFYFACAALGMCLLLGGCAASAQASADTGGFIESADLDRGVPSPESIIGHAVAAKAVRYDALERYALALAEASKLVKFTSYGKSHEGRTLYYLTITSEANHRRLDRIKADNAKLADPRKLGGPAQAERLVDSLPAVAWLNYSIHGDELSSTEAALYVMYHLAAERSAANRRLLDEVVVHLNPLVNPDGREVDRVGYTDTTEDVSFQRCADLPGGAFELHNVCSPGNDSSPGQKQDLTDFNP